MLISYSYLSPSEPQNSPENYMFIYQSVCIIDPPKWVTIAYFLIFSSSPNVVLLRVLEVLASNFGAKTGYPA
jgi:hypothetical protein